MDTLSLITAELSLAAGAMLIVFSKRLARLVSGRWVEYADEGPGRRRVEKAATVGARAIGTGLAVFGAVRLLMMII